QVRVLHWTSGRPDGISNDRVRYSHDNLTGSSGLEVDGDGNVISMEEYYPYGGTAVWTARSAVEADYKTVRYSGKERDATGLYYYGYRYYQPWAGRWLSADPAGTVDGLNLFRMCRNNPVTYTDPDGLNPKNRKPKRNTFGLFTQTVTMTENMQRYTQQPLPSFRQNDTSRRIVKLDINNTLALVHGIKAQFSVTALKEGFLRSAYSRNGPEGHYARDADRNGGGAMAVYTRAVGHAGAGQWKALGNGVGSGVNTVQFVFKPDFLLNPEHVWRASGTDNMGIVPGSTRRQKINAFERWEQQTESERNRVFMDSVNGSSAINNEQLHWEMLSLESLRVIIVPDSLPVPPDLIE
ncbi:RHS repeat-associated core domain-containing protein, partial [Enterobacter bugandensis]|uniref:RHS repeat-associated core domain-containing protein n=1 Tax=Enterobacter bugandensis TaxID=881260 RepID=UPI0021D04700